MADKANKKDENKEVQEIEEKGNSLKRDLKDIVFHEVFATEDNLPEIYHSLFPEDSSWQDHKYILVDVTTIITNNIVNDLVFIVQCISNGKIVRNILICFEMQSTWSMKILTKIGTYDINANHKVYSNYTEIDLGSMWNHLFVVYTGVRSNPEEEYNALEGNKFEVDPGYSPLNINVKVLSRRRGNMPTTKLFDDYVSFCDIFDETVKKYGRNRQAVVELIDTCIDKEIYEDFFEKNKEEVISEFMGLFEQEREFKKIEIELKNSKRKVDALSTENGDLKTENEDLKEKLELYQQKFGPIGT